MGKSSEIIFILKVKNRVLKKKIMEAQYWPLFLPSMVYTV